MAATVIAVAIGGGGGGGGGGDTLLRASLVAATPEGPLLTSSPLPELVLFSVSVGAAAAAAALLAGAGTLEQVNAVAVGNCGGGTEVLLAFLAALL